MSYAPKMQPALVAKEIIVVQPQLVKEKLIHIQRVLHADLLPDGIHLLHNFHGLGMRNDIAFQLAVPDALVAFQNLLFKPVAEERAFVGLRLLVVDMHGELLRGVKTVFGFDIPLFAENVAVAGLVEHHGGGQGGNRAAFVF